MLFILGTGYLNLGVLRLCRGEVCGKRTRHKASMFWAGTGEKGPEETACELWVMGNVERGRT